jgi:cardiolipin synthase (CMP-forming)
MATQRETETRELGASLRLRDLLLPPALLSWARLPLAVCFPLVMDWPFAAVAVLLVAGLSDLLDGWVARRFGLATVTGAVLDPIADKLFVLTVAASLLLSGRLSPVGVLLLSTRECVELPLAVWYAASAKARAKRAATAQANLGGKLATSLQFGSVAWLLLDLPGLRLWIVATAGAGLLAGLWYWYRALRQASPRHGDQSRSGVDIRRTTSG